MTEIVKFILCITLLVFTASAVFGFTKAGARRLKAVVTDQAEAKVLDNCKDYSISKTKGATIYYSGEDKAYIKLTEGIIKTYYPLLQADMNASSQDMVTAVIFSEANEMLDAIGYKKRNGALPMGAYTAGLLVIMSPSVWLKSQKDYVNAEEFLKKGPILHELAHLVFDQKTKGNYKEWFSEGMALYYESKYLGYTWSNGTAQGKPVTFKELSDNFKFLNEQESYRKSAEIVKYIVSQRGEAALKAICDDLEAGMPLNDSIQKNLDAPLSVLDYL